MTVIALALATALAYGASDFLGGLASRRANAALAVVALLKVTAVAVFLALMPLTTEVANLAAVVWGGVGGLALAIGYIAYFRGLAAGGMGVVATVTAVWAAVVPLVAGLVLGERPSPLTWSGIGVIVFAIVLITYNRAPRRVPGGAAPATGLVDATVAGIGFGMFFVALDRASAATEGGALAWPLLASAVSAVVVVGAAAIAKQVAWRAALRQAPAIVAAGVLYAAGSWTFIVAVSQGWISVVAVVAALSPAPTMLLARLFLGELLSARQLLGVLLALVGIALVSAGLAH